MEALRRPGRVGYPPSVATDAQLGFSLMAYQPAEVFFGRFEGDGRSLARITGSRARAHQGGQNGDMIGRAKAGYCSCCTRPARIAAPPSYKAGEYLGRETHDILL